MEKARPAAILILILFTERTLPAFSFQSTEPIGTSPEPKSAPTYFPERLSQESKQNIDKPKVKSLEDILNELDQEDEPLTDEEQAEQDAELAAEQLLEALLASELVRVCVRNAAVVKSRTAVRVRKENSSCCYCLVCLIFFPSFCVLPSQF